MAQSVINFRLDSNVKKEMEEVCAELGMTLTTAFTIYARAVAREKQIPFRLCADPFYSERNMNYLREVIADIESGKSTLTEHELIED